MRVGVVVVRGRWVVAVGVSRRVNLQSILNIILTVRFEVSWTMPLGVEYHPSRGALWERFLAPITGYQP